jgi:hypothetical protein
VGLEVSRNDKAIIEIYKILKWLAGDDTWQPIWDDLNKIIEEIKGAEEESPTRAEKE